MRALDAKKLRAFATAAQKGQDAIRYDSLFADEAPSVVDAFEELSPASGVDGHAAPLLDARSVWQRLRSAESERMSEKTRRARASAIDAAAIDYARAIVRWYFGTEAPAMEIDLAKVESEPPSSEHITTTEPS